MDDVLAAGLSLFGMAAKATLDVAHVGGHAADAVGHAAHAVGHAADTITPNEALMILYGSSLVDGETIIHQEERNGCKIIKTNKRRTLAAV